MKLLILKASLHVDRIILLFNYFVYLCAVLHYNQPKRFTLSREINMIKFFRLFDYNLAFEKSNLLKRIGENTNSPLKMKQ